MVKGFYSDKQKKSSTNMATYKTDAIVLRKYPLGERDQIVVLLSSTHGKIRGVAKGAKKTTGQLAGKVELSYHLSLLMAEGRNLDIISQVEILDSFKNIRTDLTKMTYALYILELLDKAIPEPEPHYQLFSLLHSTLLNIEKYSAPKVSTTYGLSLLLLSFELKLITLLGYYPEIKKCVNCGLPPVKLQRFSVNIGGLLCHRCFSRDHHAFSISPQGIELIKNSIALSLETIADTTARPGLIATITPITRQYIIEKFGHDLKSRKFLEELTRTTQK